MSLILRTNTNIHVQCLTNMHYGYPQFTMAVMRPAGDFQWAAYDETPAAANSIPPGECRSVRRLASVALKLDWKIICSQNIWLRFDFLTRGTDVCVSNWWGVRVSWVVFLNFWQDENFICSFFSACWQLPLRWTGGLPLPVGFQGGAPLFGVVVPEGALAGLGRTPVGRSA